jgi:guanylate kinase
MARKARKQKAVARRGLMLVLSSPSGAGKTTLSRMLLKIDPNIELSVSVTTRPKRPGEIDGRDYHFIDRRRFDTMVKARALLEWAEVFGHQYGTPRRPVEKALRAGRDVLFDIDWQGTQQLSEIARGDIASIFVLPPSIAELERRLHSRALDDKDVIRRRMAMASDELSHWAEYDYVIINDALDRAFVEVQTILAAERMKRVRQTGLSNFARALVKPEFVRHHAPHEITALYEEMRRRIAAIELLIAQLPATAGIGHNNPPDPIDPPPLNGDEIDEIKRYISFLQTQPAVPKKPPSQARKAASRLKIFGERISSYLAKHTDNFVSEAIKSAGKAIPIWTLFGDQLIGLSNTVTHWFSALGHL